jgi:hypothetical protein
MGGQSRNNLAAFDVVTGQLSPWKPSADSSVLALLVVGDTVYAGGRFSVVNGQSRNRLAALGAATGQLMGLNPEVSKLDKVSQNSHVDALAAGPRTVYIGGSFISVGGQSRSSLAAFDATTGQVTGWNPNAAYAVSTLIEYGGIVYAGGELKEVAGRDVGSFVAIREQPTSFSYITGNVYQEMDGDCVRKPGEKGIANALIVAQPGSYFTSTDSLGNYTLAVQPGNYTVSQAIGADQSVFVTQMCPANAVTYSVRLAGVNQMVSQIDFTNRIDTRYFLAATVSSGRRRRCFISTTAVRYCNFGDAAANNAKVYVKLPEFVVPVSADIPSTRTKTWSSTWVRWPPTLAEPFSLLTR